MGCRDAFCWGFVRLNEGIIVILKMGNFPSRNRSYYTASCRPEIGRIIIFYFLKRAIDVISFAKFL